LSIPWFELRPWLADVEDEKGERLNYTKFLERYKVTVTGYDLIV
jgi:hypothetical protein